MSGADDPIDIDRMLPTLLAALEAIETEPGAHLPCTSRAVVLDTGGGIHAGRTVRSRTPGLGACAVRVALARARAEGSTRTLAVVTGGGARRICGLCRQSLVELAPGADVRVESEAGAYVSAGRLLPRAFGCFPTEGPP